MTMVVGAERRSVLERRAHVRVARLERLLDAIGRRRASTVREAALGAKLTGVAIAVATIVLSVMFVRGRTRGGPKWRALR
jgi:hypothetical protein